MINSELFKYKTHWQSDDWAFSLHLANYSATDYTLTYTFARFGVVPFTISSQSGPGGDFVFSVPAATTTHYIPGVYTVTAALVDSGGLKATQGTTEMEIKPDPTLLANGDPRTANRKAFDDVEAALASGAGSDVIEYTIGGTIVKKNRDGLLKLRSHYLVRVRREAGIPAIGVIHYNL